MLLCKCLIGTNAFAGTSCVLIFSGLFGYNPCWLSEASGIKQNAGFWWHCSFKAKGSNSWSSTGNGLIYSFHVWNRIEFESLALWMWGWFSYSHCTLSPLLSISTSPSSQHFKQIFHIFAFSLMLAEEYWMVLFSFHSGLGMIFLWAWLYHILCRINCEIETPVVDQMHSFYFRYQIGAEWFISTSTPHKQQLLKQTGNEWPQRQWIVMVMEKMQQGQQERQTYMSSSLMLKLMETNKQHHKLPQFVWKENFGVCYIRLFLMVRLVMTSLIP